MQPINAKKPAARPPYQHQHFPKYMFNLDGTGKVTNRLVSTKQDYEAALNDGWVESPDELGEGASASPEKSGDAGNTLPDPRVAAMAGENQQLQESLKSLRKDNDDLKELNDALEAELAAVSQRLKEAVEGGTASAKVKKGK